MMILNNDRLKVMARGVVSLGLLIWLGLTVRWQEVGAALAGIDPAWLLAAVVSIVVSIIVSTIKWSLVLKAQHQPVALDFLWRTYWEGLFLNNFLPSSIGGDALRVIRVGQRLQDLAGGTASVVVERVLAMAGIALTGLLGALVLHHIAPAVLVLFSSLLLITVLMCGLIMSGLKPSGQGRIRNFLQKMATHGQKIRHHWVTLIGVLILSVVFQLLVVAVNYCLFRALHVSTISWWEACYLIPVTSAVAMIPVSINGFGVREGAYVGLLQGYQVSITMAFSCSLLFAFLVSLCSLYGGILLMLHGRREPDDIECNSGFANSWRGNEVR